MHNTTIIDGIITGQRLLKEPHCRSITLHTNELNADQKERLEGMHNQHLKILLSVNEISMEMKQAVESLQLEPVNGKTPSQKLRDVIWAYWNNTGEGSIDFEAFYTRQIEDLIKRYKTTLEQLK